MIDCWGWAQFTYGETAFDALEDIFRVLHTTLGARARVLSVPLCAVIMYVRVCACACACVCLCASLMLLRVSVSARACVRGCGCACRFAVLERCGMPPTRARSQASRGPAGASLTSAAGRAKCALRCCVRARAIFRVVGGCARNVTS